MWLAYLQRATLGLTLESLGRPFGMEGLFRQSEQYSSFSLFCESSLAVHKRNTDLGWVGRSSLIRSWNTQLSLAVVTVSTANLSRWIPMVMLTCLELPIPETSS